MQQREEDIKSIIFLGKAHTIAVDYSLKALYLAQK